MAAMNPVKQAAEAAAPVRQSWKLHRLYTGVIAMPGYLKRHIIKVSWLSPSKRYVKVQVGPTKEAYYGTQFVEGGTSRMRDAHPWLVPAFDRTRGVAQARLQTRLKQLIDKASK